jgi:hypothetical protein
MRVIIAFGWLGKNIIIALSESPAICANIPEFAAITSFHLLLGYMTVFRKCFSSKCLFEAGIAYMPIYFGQ